MKKKVCVIGQFPPPIHGLSKALDTLYNSNEFQKEFNCEKVDITDNKKFLKNLIKIKNSNADIFYLTIAQSKFGNIRDLIVIKNILKKNKKLYLHLHGGGYRNIVDNFAFKWQKKMNYKYISKCSGVIVLSESLKFNFKDMIDDCKIFVVPNCVDDEFVCDEKDFNEKINNIDEKNIKQVLYLSNFIRSKGYDKVLEMAKIEKEKFIKTGIKKFHFDFAGKFFDENEKMYFENYIKSNNLEDFITYHGIVKGVTKKELLYNSDIFVLLTRYPKEGQPISILEAMANGMVIITTDHAGIPDIVENKINGFIVDETKNVNKYLENIDYKKIFNTNRIEYLNKYRRNIYLNKLIDILKGDFCG